jgi:1-acyl-sn-glycerol-3-phosphate acyltransferase
VSDSAVDERPASQGGGTLRYGDLAWAIGQPTMGTVARIFTRARAYGRERVPREGGLVIAANHLHWVDVPLLGALSPRNLNYVAKVEAHRVPGLGRFIRLFGTIAVRRGESDREAVRLMRQAVRDGRALGLYVEGTRQRSGRPGRVQPGAAMVAIQEEVPVVVAAIHGTQHWRLGNFAPSSVVFGEPMRFDALPKTGRGYREASTEIERELHRLFDWLVDVHARGRPRGLVPPARAG